MSHDEIDLNALLARSAATGRGVLKLAEAEYAKTAPAEPQFEVTLGLTGRRGRQTEIITASTVEELMDALKPYSEGSWDYSEQPWRVVYVDATWPNEGRTDLNRVRVFTDTDGWMVADPTDLSQLKALYAQLHPAADNASEHKVEVTFTAWFGFPSHAGRHSATIQGFSKETLISAARDIDIVRVLAEIEATWSIDGETHQALVYLSMPTWLIDDPFDLEQLEALRQKQEAQEAVRQESIRRMSEGWPGADMS